MVDFIHAGVFVPLIGPRDGHTERFSFNASSNPSLRLKYWDDGAYVSELEITTNIEDTKSVNAHENQNAAPNPDPNKEGLVAISDEGSGKSKKRKGDASGGLGTKKVRKAPYNEIASLKAYRQRRRTYNFGVIAMQSYTVLGAIRVMVTI